MSTEIEILDFELDFGVVNQSCGVGDFMQEHYELHGDVEKAKSHLWFLMNLALRLWDEGHIKQHKLPNGDMEFYIPLRNKTFRFP